MALLEVSQITMSACAPKMQDEGAHCWITTDKVVPTGSLVEWFLKKTLSASL